LSPGNSSEKQAFPPLARPLNSFHHGPQVMRDNKNGRIQMSVQSSSKRTLVALVAAFAMSTLAVGAAVGPAQASTLQAPVNG